MGKYKFKKKRRNFLDRDKLINVYIVLFKFNAKIIKKIKINDMVNFFLVEVNNKVETDININHSSFINS